MQEANRFTAGEFATAQCLHNTTCNTVISTDAHRPRTSGVNILIKGCNPLNTIFVVIGTRERHVPNIGDLRTVPGI